MAFPVATAPTPIAIADIEICLYSPDPTGVEQSGASFSVQVRYSDNSIQQLSGDLVPHLSTAQINSLLAFMASMRTKAISEILP